MSETCENWLGLVKSCIYDAHKLHEIYQVLPYSVRQYLINVVLFGAKDL